MRGLPDIEEHDDATKQVRACCALCAVKEFLVVVTLFIICVDLADVYSNVIRVTGTNLLPFPGNHTAFYYTAVPELNWYDMVISVFDLAFVIVLSLSGARARPTSRRKALAVICSLSRVPAPTQCAASSTAAHLAPVAAPSQGPACS